MKFAKVGRWLINLDRIAYVDTAAAESIYQGNLGVGVNFGHGGPEERYDIFLKRPGDMDAINELISAIEREIT